MIAGVGPFMGLLLASSTRRVEAALLGLLIGDLASLITLFSLARRHLLMGTVFAHAGLLALPVGLAALGPLIVGGDGLGPRALMLAVGGFWLALGTPRLCRPDASLSPTKGPPPPNPPRPPQPTHP